MNSRLQRVKGYWFVLAEEYKSRASRADQTRSRGIGIKLELNASEETY
jgi:hypothetical protein